MLAHRVGRPLVVVVLFGAAVFAAARLSAQQQLASLQEVESNYQKNSNTIFKLEGGQLVPGKSEHDALDALAKYLVYRFVSSPPPDATKIQKYQYDFKSHIDRIELKDSAKANREFVRQFGPILKQRYKDLFDQDFLEYRYSIVNAAPTLLLAAKLREDSFGEYLAELVTDHNAGKGNGGKNRHDALKLYAIRGLREYVPVEVREKDAVLTAAQEKRKARELRTVSALLAFIDKPMPKNLSEPEQDAIRFLRREAIETLAATEAPALVFGKALVEAPVAPVLLRVLSPKSGFEPAPGLAERIEAAIGVCQLRSAKVPDYQSELGVYLVGRTILDVLTAYNKDLVDIRGVVDKRPPLLPWRLTARRLETALKKLAENSKGLPTQAAAAQLAQEGTRLLKDIQGRDLQGINAGLLTSFRTVVERARPKTNQVFKNIKEYTIELDGE